MTGLHSVADHLAKQATTNYRKGAGYSALADAFGRTAYNRYYYACYLDMRRFIGELNSQWAGVNHAEVPNHLTGAVLKKINRELINCEKNGLMSSGQVFSKKSIISTALHTMASIMAEAYTIRCTVDYEPDIMIVYKNEKILIENTTVATAKDWLSKINIEKFKVIKVMKEVGLV